MENYDFDLRFRTPDELADMFGLAVEDIEGFEEEGCFFFKGRATVRAVRDFLKKKEEQFYARRAFSGNGIDRI